MATLPTHPAKCLNGRQQRSMVPSRNKAAWIHLPGCSLPQLSSHVGMPSRNAVARRCIRSHCRRHTESKSNTARYSTSSNVWRCSSSSFGHPSVIAADGGMLYHQATTSFLPKDNPQTDTWTAKDAVHPRALVAFYVAYVFCCFAERLWRFGLPAILATMSADLQPVAAYSLLGQFAVFLGAPLVGDLMDSLPRVTALLAASAIQTAAIVISALLVMSALLSSSSTANLMRQPWFLVLVLVCGVERLAGIATGVAFERDWVMLLAGPDRTKALALANSILRRVDLFCETAGPLFFGWLLSTAPLQLCLQVATLITLVSLPLLLVVCTITNYLSGGALNQPREDPTWKFKSIPHQKTPSYSTSSSKSSLPAATSPSAAATQAPATSSSPALLLANAHSEQPAYPSRSTAAEATSPLLQPPPLDVAQSAASDGFESASDTDLSDIDTSAGPLPRWQQVLASTLRGWRYYFSSPVLPASLAYVLLYSNAMLSPGSLMTSLLTHRGVDVSIIGVYRGACAAVGFSTTILSPFIIARLGVMKAGASALVFQASCLFLSVLVFLLAPPHNNALLVLFLALIVLSRLGYWTYDVVDAQIFQMSIPSSRSNLLGSTEVAFASLAEIAMLGVAMAFHEPKFFGPLSVLSMLVVAMAALVFLWWTRQEGTRQLPCFKPTHSHHVAAAQ